MNECKHKNKKYSRVCKDCGEEGGDTVAYSIDQNQTHINEPCQHQVVVRIVEATLLDQLRRMSI